MARQADFAQCPLLTVELLPRVLQLRLGVIGLRSTRPGSELNQKNCVRPFDDKPRPTAVGSWSMEMGQPSLAERLGYRPDDRLLIVSCDDLGSSHSANASAPRPAACCSTST